MTNHDETSDHAPPEESRFRVLFENAFAFLIVVDRTGIVLDANRTARAWTSRGGARRSIPAPDHPIRADEIFGDDEDGARRLKAGIETAVGGNRDNFVGFVRHDDDKTGMTSPVLMDFSLTPLRFDGQEVSAVLIEGHTRPVAPSSGNEPTDNERQMLIAQEITRVGNWEFDVATKRISGSPQMFALLEYAPEVSGPLDQKTVRRRYHPDDRAKHVRATHRAVRGQPFDIEIRRLCMDGSIRWLHSQGRPIFDADGRVEKILGTLQDITERKNAEQRLRLSEERLRRLVEATSSITWRFSAEDPQKIRVAAWREFTGQSEDDERNGGWMETIHPDDRARAVTEIQKNLESSTGGAVEYRVRRRDGVYRWFRNHAVPVFNHDRSLREWIGSSVDITEEKESEAARSRQEAERKEIVDLMAQQAFLVDTNGTVTFINRRVYEYFGIGDETPPQTVAWETLIHPDDVSLARQMRRNERERSVSYEYRIRLRRHDGVFRWHQYRIVPIPGADGSTDHLIGTATDIHAVTEAAQAQEQKDREAREVVELMSQIAYAVKPDGAVLYFNRRFYEFAGVPSEVPPGEVNWTEFVHPDSLPMMGEMVRRLPTRREPYEYEVPVKRKDGVYRWHRFRSVPILSADGDDVRHVISIGTDITDQKVREAEYERLRREAEEKAITDPLTGLPNHRTFYSYLEEKAASVNELGGQFALVVLDMDNFKLLNDTYGVEGGDSILCQVGEMLRESCRTTDMVARIGGDEFAILLPVGEREQVHEVSHRLRESLQNLNLKFPGERGSLPLRLSFGVCLFPSETANFKEAIYQANRRCMLDKSNSYDHETEVYRQSLAEKSEGFAMLNALIAAIDNKDTYTMRHSADVMRYALLIAESLGLGMEERNALKAAALIHDVGKIGIPFRLLRAPGPLTPEERRTIQQHVTIGALLVGSIPELAHAQDAVKYHHERWDGDGYPSGLQGADIPLSARIVAVADAFSAMTVDRPYRQGLSLSEAIRILESGSGTQWDPLCVTALVSRLPGG